jgi:hypothetical protein
MDIKKHSNVIEKYKELNSLLKPHGLFIHCWGRIAIAKIDDPYNNWLLNNIDSIEEIDAWVKGFLYGKSVC